MITLSLYFKSSLINYLTLAKDYEIPKNRLRLETIIGQGQFGDVHRGTYNSLVSWNILSVNDNNLIEVTKPDSWTERFL